MYESGICYIGQGRWSATVMVSDINYVQSTYDQRLSIFGRYCELLNSLDSDCPIQFTVRSRRYLKDPLKGVYLQDKGDGLDGYRNEINGILYEKMMERENSMLREKFLTFSVGAPDYKAARLALSRMEASLSAQLRQMGCGVKGLSGEERLRLISEELRPLEVFEWSYDRLSLGGSTKDAIAPDSLNFRDSVSSYQLSDTHYGQTLYIRDMPAQMGDKLIGELIELSLNMTISIHIHAMDQSSALELVKRKVAYMDAQTAEEQKKALRGGYDASMVPHELEYSRKEAKELLESMEQQNQRLFRVALLVNILEEGKKALEGAVKKACDAARKNGCEMGKINYEQEAALNSVLNIGRLFVDKQRTLPTASAAVFIPFTAQELFDASGNYCGVNANTGNLVLFDRRLLKSKNSVVLGVPGSGKSFAVKRDIVFNFFNDPSSDIIILDPEREYAQLTEALNGEEIRIGGNAGAYVNPLDVTDFYDDEAAPIELKINFIFSFFEAISGRFGLSPAQKTVLDRVSRATYRGYYQSGAPMPTLRDFYRNLKSQPENEAAVLALNLEIYVEGTLSGFAHQTNVNTQNRVVCFDVKDLGSSLKTVGMLIVLDQIWNRITSNRSAGKRTWVYIDEAQLLFAHEESAEYFSLLNSRGRKWGTGVTTITQNAQNLLFNDVARTIFSNAGSLFLFSQASTDISDLASALSLEEEQLSYASDSPPGSGIIVIGSSIVPFYDEFPKDTELYKKMTSKPEELASYDGQKR
jgi:hypothetical protein